MQPWHCIMWRRILYFSSLSFLDLELSESSFHMMHGLQVDGIIMKIYKIGYIGGDLVGLGDGPQKFLRWGRPMHPSPQYLEKYCYWIQSTKYELKECFVLKLLLI